MTNGGKRRAAKRAVQGSGIRHRSQRPESPVIRVSRKHERRARELATAEAARAGHVPPAYGDMSRAARKRLIAKAAEGAAA